MRKLLCLLLLSWLMCPTARAAAYFCMEHAVYTGLRGETVAAVFDRLRSGPAGWLLALDEEDTVLGQRQIESTVREGALIFRIPPDAPAGQTIRFVFRCDGVDEVQQECLLAADSAQRDVILRGPADDRKIALTFDAAYGLGRLEALLDVLARYDARCTFFLQGDFVLENPEWTARIARLGHEIGNHTMHHPEDIRQLSDDAAYWEIRQCSDAIQAVTGRAPTLYRPPAGYTSLHDRAISRALNCEVILWTFDSRDGFLADSDPEEIWRRMLRCSEPGAIVLMHVYGYYTPEILEAYLPLMQEQGYAFVTVSDLLGLTDAE